MTLFEKIWKSHIVKEIPDGPSILYIDRHYIHEVTSPQAFSGLKQRGRKVFRPSQTFATCDHNVPTINQELPVGDPSSRIPLEQLEANTKEHGITYFPLGNSNNGVVHIIGPELGITLPGMTVVCGDSHTSTHGAFGSIAFGIGTSEVEMVLATQTLLQNKPKQMLIRVEGELARGVCAKDLILYIISRLGTSAGTGHFIEFAGSAIESLSMEGRMTICNMSIEMGARGGLIAPDQKTIDYIKGREYSPKGELWENSVKRWMELKSDDGAHYDTVVEIDATAVEPMITWGTNPGMGMAVNGSIPLTGLDEMSVNALKYMEFPDSEYLLQEGEQLLEKGYQLLGLPVDYIFLGSCTNGRIEDFRAFAGLVKGRKKAPGITVWLVPGSKMVERQIEDEGLGDILRSAGFEVRQPGCSACLGMNDDKVPAGKYCISTTNRNFEGRQGPGARTILAGPLVAAAAAITGVISDPRDFQKKFTIVESRAVVIPLDNIDTDQIIPARFLKTTSREGFGEKLFYDWRYDASGEAIKEFVLNSTDGAGSILVAGRNFGCGSSREHAAWAVADYGFRAVVSTSFADIFRSNALNNGLLPVQVSESFLKTIIEFSKSKKDITLKIDLMKKEITNQETGDSEKFEINPYKQECLINGYDDIDYLLSNIKEIEEYELYKASSL